MKVRLTTLNKNEFFEQNGYIYKKLDNREKSGRAENVKSGEVLSFPTMLYVSKISKEEAEAAVKPKRRKVVEVESAEDFSHLSNTISLQPSGTLNE